MANYIDIINDEDTLFNMYEIIKIDDDKTEPVSIDLDTLIVNKNDEIKVIVWEYSKPNNLNCILRLENAFNNTFGYITVNEFSVFVGFGRYLIINKLCMMYKHIEGVDFQYYLSHSLKDTLEYINDIQG